MAERHNTGSTSRLLALVAWCMLALLAPAPDAAAHAELRQASPRVGSTVGGEFHSVALQFTGLDPVGTFRADLLDPTGVPIGGQAVREDGRIVIPIEPLELPGVYTVSYTTTGVDGDIVSESFVFRYDPTAAEPEGIDIDLSAPTRFGWLEYLLLLGASAIAGFLAHRVRFAWREHRAAKRPDRVDVPV